jgi:hypothetical protein
MYNVYFVVYIYIGDVISCAFLLVIDVHGTLFIYFMLYHESCFLHVSLSCFFIKIIVIRIRDQF